jgi:hypothetical protein
MPFPALQPRTDTRRGVGGVAELWAEATGVPDNGVNTIPLPFLAMGVPFDQIDEDWLMIKVDPTTTPSSVMGFSYVPGSLAASNKQSIQVDFDQTGADPCLMIVSVVHSLVT